jgi:mannose-6-phosphate isomerase
MDSTLYPLLFEPILKPRIWGGRRMETLLGRAVPAGQTIGESWELSDHGDDLSVVAGGPLRGCTLRQLIQAYGTRLLGRTAAAGGRFPLLFKWIDASQPLSVQVHPGDGHQTLPPGELGKTECWVVADCDPDAVLYLGLRQGIGRAELEQAVARGTVDRCLNAIAVRPGDVVFVPAGTVHAIGSGILQAEIQQSSDTTWRLFDWNRVDPATGRPRVLHIAQALSAIDFDRQRSGLALPRVEDRDGTPVETLVGVECPYFRIERLAPVRPFRFVQSDRCHVVMCIAGRGELLSPIHHVPLGRGDTVLLPAGEMVACEPEAGLVLLDVWVP